MLIETREDEHAGEQGWCSRGQSLHAKRASFGHPLPLFCTLVIGKDAIHVLRPSCIVSVFASRNLPYSPASTNTKSPVTLLHSIHMSSSQSRSTRQSLFPSHHGMLSPFSSPKVTATHPLHRIQ